VNRLDVRLLILRRRGPRYRGVVGGTALYGIEETIMTERDDVDRDGDEPVLDAEEIAVTSHLDADEADLVEQSIEVPEDPEEATER
jgi:hypothetical protein